MYLVSFLYPNQKKLNISEINILDLTEWKHTKRLSLGLCIATILIYVLLGRVG